MHEVMRLCCTLNRVNSVESIEATVCVLVENRLFDVCIPGANFESTISMHNFSMENRAHVSQRGPFAARGH